MLLREGSCCFNANNKGFTSTTARKRERVSDKVLALGTPATRSFLLSLRQAERDGKWGFPLAETGRVARLIA